MRSPSAVPLLPQCHITIPPHSSRKCMFTSIIILTNQGVASACLCGALIRMHAISDLSNQPPPLSPPNFCFQKILFTMLFLFWKVMQRLLYKFF